MKFDIFPVLDSRPIIYLVSLRRHHHIGIDVLSKDRGAIAKLIKMTVEDVILLPRHIPHSNQCPHYDAFSDVFTMTSHK